MRAQGEPPIQITHTHTPTDDELAAIAHGRAFEYQDVARSEDYVPELEQARVCLALAMDARSQHRAFFLQCLYRIVWEVVRGPSLPNPWGGFAQPTARREVAALLDAAATSVDPAVAAWAERSRHLMRQPEQADRDDWYATYTQEGAAERRRREGVARKRGRQRHGCRATPS